MESSLLLNSYEKLTTGEGFSAVCGHLLQDFQCGQFLVDRQNSLAFNMSGTDKLISAIKSENIGKLAELLETLDLDEVNGKKNGETALHIACREKSYEAVDLLVAKVGVDVNAINYNEETPLQVAVDNNNVHAVSKILTHPQVHVNTQDKYGWTPLHRACHYKKHQMVSALLGCPGVDINIQNNIGWTPLHRACYNNNHQIVWELLRCPAVDVNVRNRYGDTPVMLSAQRCSEETLKLLLEDTRVNLDVKDEEGRGLEAQVERYQRDSKTKEKCLELISNERTKRENRKALLLRAEKEMADFEKKLDIRKQKKKDLNERQSSEKKMMAKKHREDEATLKKRQKDKEMILKKKQKDEEMTLKKKQKDEEMILKKKQKDEEMTLKKKRNAEETSLKKRHEEEASELETSSREDEVEQRHMALLRECRDELVLNVQKLSIDPAQDTSGACGKLEAAQKSLECPICFDLMKPPTKIWMCRLSHLICDSCKDGVDKKKDNRGICPTCMTERVDLRAIVAENFARATFN